MAVILPSCFSTLGRPAEVRVLLIIIPGQVLLLSRGEYRPEPGCLGPLCALCSGTMDELEWVRAMPRPDLPVRWCVPPSSRPLAPGAPLLLRCAGPSWGDRRAGMVQLNVNGKLRDCEAEADTPLLWVLREQLGLTGTKYGCGIAQCGACTVHIDGVPTRSCVRPLSTVGPQEKILTIEGLSADASMWCRRPGTRWTCRNAASVRA